MKIFLLLIVAIVSLNAMNVSEIASFSNQRDNFLYGKGVVIGLEGTGDRTKFTNIILNNILNNSNVKMDIKDVRSKNIASVMITAKIPPFLKKGDMFNL
jgi:flagellar P-ring protein precursor FlgI